MHSSASQAETDHLVCTERKGFEYLERKGEMIGEKDYEKERKDIQLGGRNNIKGQEKRVT